jgi:CheY-like chemotaxis protein
LSLCEELKRHPRTRDIRVVMMSGLDRRHIRERAKKAGAHAFLAKPVDPADLFGAIGSGMSGGSEPQGISSSSG